MKKIYALLIGVIVGSTAMAQSFENLQSIAKSFDKDQITPMVAPRVDVPIGSPLRATDILFEDFQEGAPDLPAGWGNSVTTTVADLEEIDAFYVINADEANAGLYWPVPNLPGNYFAGANDDALPCDCFMNPVTLTTPEMDFTDAVNPALSFDYFHDQNFGGGDAGVSISIDGGTTWEVLVSALAWNESVWQTQIVPLYDFEGYESVMIQFTWTDNDSWATGIAIDNVGVGSLADYNAAASQAFFGDWDQEFGAGSFEFSRVPEAQVAPISVTAIIANNGFNDLENVTMEVEIFQDGTSQGTWMADTPIDMLATLNDTTLVAMTDYTPTVGEVSFEITVMNDTGDEDPTNDTAGASMMVTDYTYARDIDGAQAFFGATIDGSYQYGNLYDIHVDQACGGVEFAIGAGTDEGAFVQAWVYDVVDYNIDNDGFVTEPNFGGEFFQTVEYEVTADDLNAVGGNNFVVLPFMDGAEMLTAGKQYLAVIATSGSDVIVTPVSGSNWQTASWFYDGDWAAYLSVPMVRLNMDASIAVQEENIADFFLMQNVPNPAVDNTRIYYHLDVANQVRFQVIDATGRIAFEDNMGNLQSGSHFIDLDVSNFASGVYTYTLQVGGEIETKQLIVR